MSNVKNELVKKLEDLEHREFMVQMIDHWTQEDYRYDNELHQEIMKTKKEIEFVDMILKDIPNNPRKLRTGIDALNKIDKRRNLVKTPEESRLLSQIIEEYKKKVGDL